MGKLKEIRREASQYVSEPERQLAKKVRKTVRGLPESTSLSEIVGWLDNPEGESVSRKVRRLAKSLDKTGEKGLVTKRFKRVIKPGHNTYLDTLANSWSFICQEPEPVRRIKGEYRVIQKTAAFLVLALAVKHREG